MRAGRQPDATDSRFRMTRFLLVALVLLGVATIALALRPFPSAQADAADAVVMRVGDAMHVEGARIGCQVARRDGRPVIDCRRAGKLAGTFTALFDERRVRVARFRSKDTARVVFTAKHRGRARKCAAASKGVRR
jgi:hypothetical protein